MKIWWLTLKKKPKNTKNAFFACFWAYFRQLHNHKSLVTSIFFASINTPRTNPKNFHEIFLWISGFENFNFDEVKHGNTFWPECSSMQDLHTMTLSDKLFVAKEIVICLNTQQEVLTSKNFLNKIIFFLYNSQLVQCKPQLNHQTQPFWVQGVWLKDRSQLLIPLLCNCSSLLSLFYV